MSSVISSLFFFVLAISVLIAVHEFGHFWVARRCGVKVLRFSIGFGKPLLTWHRKGDATEYVIAAVPMGGYVKMLDEREGEVKQDELDLAFNRKPLASRFIIVAAGPFFNFILAILAYWLIFILGVSGMKPLIGEVSANSLAEIGGFQQKDRIVRIDGDNTATWHAVMMKLLDKSLGDKMVRIEVQDINKQLHTRTLNFGAEKVDMDRDNLLESLGLHPYRPNIPAVIGELQLGAVAEKAGFKAGDKIVAADGELIHGWEQWVTYIQARPDIPINVTIERDGVEVMLELTPARIKVNKQDIGRIGASVKFPTDISDELYAIEKYPLHQAIGVAIKKTWDMSALTLKMLGNMLIGEVSVSNISGPISIAKYAGQSASIGLVSFLNFMALISISLGVLNLLPIPLLDGGHLMYYLVEWVKGSPVSDNVQLLGQRVGIALLAILMVLAFYNDIERLLG